MALGSHANTETQQTLIDVDERRKPCWSCGCYFPHCGIVGCLPGYIDRNTCNGHYFSCWLTDDGIIDPTYRPKHRSPSRDEDDEQTT